MIQAVNGYWLPETRIQNAVKETYRAVLEAAFIYGLKVDGFSEIPP